MSEVERHIGKIKPIDLKGMDSEEYCKKKCEDLGIADKIKWYNSFEETLLSEHHGKPIVKVNGEFWEVIEDKEEEDYNDISILRPNNDGTFDFIFQFYNGGTCFEEMVHEAIEKYKKKNE